MSRLHIAYASAPGGFGGVSRVNHVIAQILRRQFDVVDDPQQADLQVCSGDWNPQTHARRLFVDHGSFADASFWAYTAPRLRCSDTILVGSRVCEQVADRLFGASRPTLRRVPYFADTEMFAPRDERPAVRLRLADQGMIPPDGPLLLTVSGYARRKNLHLALHLLARLKPTLPEASLAIVGRANEPQRDYREHLNDLARRLGVAGAVRFVDPLPHARLRNLMHASDLLVHLTTCRLENFGLVVAEAFAAGLPVLAADWGGLRDLVEPGQTGLLARTWLSAGGPRVDWLGALAPVLSLLGESQKRERFAHRALAFARQHLSLAAFEARLCDAVRQTLDAPGGERGLARLSPAGEDLLFTTIRLNRAHPGIRSTSDEYRLLLERDAGATCRVLSGPAASQDVAPRVTRQSRLYPVVAFEVTGPGEIRVTDAAWPETLRVGEAAASLARACDGERRVEDLAARMSTDGAVVTRTAQVLVDAGLLGAVGGAGAADV